MTTLRTSLQNKGDRLPQRRRRLALISLEKSQFAAPTRVQQFASAESCFATKILSCWGQSPSFLAIRRPPCPCLLLCEGGWKLVTLEIETNTKCRTRAALDRTEKGGWKAFLFFLENSIISYRLYIFLVQNLLQTKTDLAFARIPISCIYTLKQNAIKSK